MCAKGGGGILDPMRASLPVLLVCATTLLLAAPASAQRLPFERTFDATNDVVIDVSTMRGKIDIVGGEQGRVVIAGTVTVRTGFNLPWDAVAIARRVAAHPPVS